MSDLTITTGEPGYSFPLLITDMADEGEIGVQVGTSGDSGGRAAVLDLQSARTLRDYLAGWITNQEAPAMSRRPHEPYTENTSTVALLDAYFEGWAVCVGVDDLDAAVIVLAHAAEDGTRSGHDIEALRERAAAVRAHADSIRESEVESTHRPWCSWCETVRDEAALGAAEAAYRAALTAAAEADGEYAACDDSDHRSFADAIDVRDAAVRDVADAATALLGLLGYPTAAPDA